MVERKTPGEIILLVFIYAAVTLVGFVCLYPMLYCLAAYVPCHMRANAPAGAPPAKGAGRITPDSWPGISQSLSSS